MSGVIYILTNPSFEQYVKIGYADDVDKRMMWISGFASLTVASASRMHFVNMPHMRWMQDCLT